MLTKVNLEVGKRISNIDEPKIKIEMNYAALSKMINARHWNENTTIMTQQNLNNVKWQNIVYATLRGYEMIQFVVLIKSYWYPECQFSSLNSKIIFFLQASCPSHVDFDSPAWVAVHAPAVSAPSRVPRTIHILYCIRHHRIISGRDSVYLVKKNINTRKYINKLSADSQWYWRYLGDITLQTQDM